MMTRTVLPATKANVPRKVRNNDFFFKRAITSWAWTLSSLTLSRLTTPTHGLTNIAMAPIRRKIDTAGRV